MPAKKKTASVQIHNVDSVVSVTRDSGNVVVSIKFKNRAMISATLAPSEARKLAEAILGQYREEDIAPKQQGRKAPKRKNDPYAEGADAAVAGSSDTMNPYEPATDDHLSWNDGYNSVSEEF